MTNEGRKKLLYKHKLDASDFYMMEDKVILRRTGIDKLEKQNPVTVSITSIQTVPYGDKVSTTILGIGRLKDMNAVTTVASANPDNCQWPHYAEVALKRLRHRLLLMLLDLYEYDIFSEEESKDFVETNKKDVGSIVNEIKAIDSKRAVS